MKIWMKKSIKILEKRKSEAKKVRKEKIRLAKLQRIIDGNTIYTAKCSSCHGINAQKRPRNSKQLLGLHEFKYFHKMKEYQLANGTSHTQRQMNDIVQQLSDKDIKYIYLYLRSLKK